MNAEYKVYWNDPVTDKPLFEVFFNFDAAKDFAYACYLNGATNICMCQVTCTITNIPETEWLCKKENDK